MNKKNYNKFTFKFSNILYANLRFYTFPSKGIWPQLARRLTELHVFCFFNIWSNYAIVTRVRTFTTLPIRCEYIVAPFPRRSENRFNTFINALVLKSTTTSIFTAFVTKHIKIHAYPFITVAFHGKLSLAINGLAKSTPLILNGRDGVMRSLGNPP